MNLYKNKVQAFLMNNRKKLALKISVRFENYPGGIKCL